MRRDDQNSSEDESPEREDASVGQTLRDAREALDLTLDQVSADLRIEPQFLEALENNDFASLAAPVFTKGYLRQYAVRVDLDDKAILTQYYRQVGAQDVPTLKSNTLEIGSDQTQARWLIAGSALAFLLAAVAIWQFSAPDPVTEAEPGPVPDAETAIEIEETSPVTAPEIISEVPQDPVDAVVEEADETEAAPVEVPEEIEAPTLQVEIVFEEDSWTEVIDASGERLFYGLGSAGARTRFSATPPLSFFLGNANGVELLVNDTPFAIPDQNRQGNLARFVILETGN